MYLNDIMKLDYSSLFRNLPAITTYFSTSIYLSKGNLHRWNRIHNQRIIKTVLMPKEIEEYVIKRIDDIDEFKKSDLNMAMLIKNCWYISYLPFQEAIMNLINKIIHINENKVNKKTIILIDNLMRKNNRPFDSFFIGDLIWLLGIYYNLKIYDSKLITYRNKKMESNFPQNKIFPIRNYSKEITETDEIDIYKDILKYNDFNCIIYLTKLLGNYDGYFNKLESIKNQYFTEENKDIIIWELGPCHKINSEKYSINFLQGFYPKNFLKIEEIISIL